MAAQSAAARQLHLLLQHQPRLASSQLLHQDELRTRKRGKPPAHLLEGHARSGSAWLSPKRAPFTRRASLRAWPSTHTAACGSKWEPRGRATLSEAPPVPRPRRAVRGVRRPARIHSCAARRWVSTARALRGRTLARGEPVSRRGSCDGRRLAAARATRSAQGCFEDSKRRWRVCARPPRAQRLCRGTRRQPNQRASAAGRGSLLESSWCGPTRARAPWQTGSLWLWPRPLPQWAWWPWEPWWPWWPWKPGRRGSARAASGGRLSPPTRRCARRPTWRAEQPRLPAHSLREAPAPARRRLHAQQATAARGPTSGCSGSAPSARWSDLSGLCERLVAACGSSAPHSSLPRAWAATPNRPCASLCSPILASGGPPMVPLTVRCAVTSGLCRIQVP